MPRAAARWSNVGPLTSGAQSGLSTKTFAAGFRAAKRPMLSWAGIKTVVDAKPRTQEIVDANQCRVTTVLQTLKRSLSDTTRTNYPKRTCCSFASTSKRPAAT